jgi:hypothetical protein
VQGCAGERGYLRQWQGRSRRDYLRYAGRIRQGTGQRVKRAALILKVRDTVMVVGIGGCTIGGNVMVRGDWRGLIHVERMVVKRWKQSNRLGAHEEP